MILLDELSYNAVLEKSQKRNLDIGGWLGWFLKCYQRAIRHSETLLAELLTRGERVIEPMSGR